MKNFVNVKARRAERQGLLRSVLFVIIISAVLVAGIFYISNMGNEQGIKLTREAAVRTAVECYAIEGIYPPNIWKIITISDMIRQNIIFIMMHLHQTLCRQ